MSEADWYAVLDVPEDCSSEDVKAAYRRKLLETHPDKNTNSSLDVSIALHDIKEAFRILTDCDLRSQFDSRRDAVLTKGINAREATLQEFSIETTRTGDTLYRLACRCGDYFEVRFRDKVSLLS